MVEGCTRMITTQGFPRKCGIRMMKTESRFSAGVLRTRRSLSRERKTSCLDDAITVPGCYDLFHPVISVPKSWLILSFNYSMLTIFTFVHLSIYIQVVAAQYMPLHEFGMLLNTTLWHTLIYMVQVPASTGQARGSILLDDSRNEA